MTLEARNYNPALMQGVVIPTANESLPTGPTGPTGITGPTGVTGATGPSGPSA